MSARSIDAGNLEVQGFSADVRMELRLDGRVLPISHLGPDFLVVTTPIDHPPTEAEIVMAIDGYESRWPVRLDKGISTSERRTNISRCQPANGSTVR